MNWGQFKYLVCYMCLITGRNEVVAKVIFLHLFVILFTGGVVVSHKALRQTRPGQTHTPSDQAHTPQTRPLPPRPDPSPQTRHTTPPRTRHTTTPRTRHIPPDQAHPPGPGTPSPNQTHTHTHTPPTPPPEADSGIRSTSGR